MSTSKEKLALVAGAIRDVPDFPKPGIIFKDITPLLGSPEAFAASMDLIAERVKAWRPEIIVGMESRGFLFGTPLGERLGLGFAPVRKPGKLPGETESVSYELEYGSDTLEIHRDAISDGQRVLIIDDLLATGGTAGAVVDLIGRLGGEVVGCQFVIELGFLDGRAKLGDVPVDALLEF